MTTEILQTGFHVGGKRIDFVSGEFHYWRVKKENWDKVIERLVSMGLDVVSTYVPWNFHAVDDHFDFRGKTDPQRDLAGFIDLVKKRSLMMMIRPGPYIYAEWKYAGVPKEAFMHHRFSAQFKLMGSKYIKAVCDDCIVPNLSTRGGPIFVLQADNEVDPWVRFYREQLGLSQGNGPFKEFLIEKYGTLENLNRAWGRRYDDIGQVRAFEEHPLMGGDPPEDGIFEKYLDYRSFLDWSVEQIIAWVADEYRRNGVDVPIIANTYDDLTFHDVSRLRRIVDLPCMDIYLAKHLPESEFLKLSYWVKAYSAYSKFPLATEFQSGIWLDSLYSTGPIDGKHQKLLGMAAMAWGLKGWNWYMAVGRDNWTCAPVNEWGLVNPDVYEAIKCISNVYNRVKLYDLRRLTGLAMAHYRPQLLLKHPPEILSDQWAWGVCFGGLHQAGLDFTFYNPEIDEERRRFVLYAGTEMMRQPDARNLSKLCQSGAHVIFFRKFPMVDFAGNELQEFRDMPRPAGSRAEPRGSSMRVQISFGDHTRTLTTRGFEFYEGEWRDKISVRGIRKTSAYVDSEPVLEDHTVGLSKSVGDGRITLLGLDPTSSLIEFLIKAFSIPIPVTATTPFTHASLHQDIETESRYVLFMINNSSQRQLASAMLNLPPGKYRFTAFGSENQGMVEGGIVNLNQNMDWKDGEIVELIQTK